MECNFKAIARVTRRRKKGMFGVILEVPKSLIECTSVFWLVYGNACFYCNTNDDINKICSKYDWVVRFFDGTEVM